MIQVNVGELRSGWSSERPPPLPRFAVQSAGIAREPDASGPAEGSSISLATSEAQPSLFFPSAFVTQSSTQPSSTSRARGTQNSAQGSLEIPGRREIAVQTDFPRGLTYEEMCSVHLVTTTSRTPGAVHLFPECHALRGVTSTNRRMFCRYCLTAAARTGI